MFVFVLHVFSIRLNWLCATSSIQVSCRWPTSILSSWGTPASVVSNIWISGSPCVFVEPVIICLLKCHLWAVWLLSVCVSSTCNYTQLRKGVLSYLIHSTLVKQCVKSLILCFYDDRTPAECPQNTSKTRCRLKTVSWIFGSCETTSLLVYHTDKSKHQVISCYTWFKYIKVIPISLSCVYC